jgi:hypothetical protein
VSKCSLAAHRRANGIFKESLSRTVFERFAASQDESNLSCGGGKGNHFIWGLAGKVCLFGDQWDVLNNLNNYCLLRWQVVNEQIIPRKQELICRKWWGGETWWWRVSGRRRLDFILALGLFKAVKLWMQFRILLYNRMTLREPACMWIHQLFHLLTICLLLFSLLLLGSFKEFDLDFVLWPRGGPRLLIVTGV